MVTWWIHGHDPAFLNETSGETRVATEPTAVEAPEPAEEPVPEDAGELAQVAE